MERRELEIFLMLAEELHFGRTAERLHVSTARVSQTIRTMERRVGAPLFERTSRQVALTPIGRQLERDVRPAYDQIEVGVRRAIDAARAVQGALRVGFIGAAAGQFVLAAAELFQARHPGCEVVIRESQFSDGLELLRTDDVDMLLATFPFDEPDLTCSPVIFSEERLLGVSARHPFARRESVSMDDLARDKVLRSPSAVPDIWDAWLAPRYTKDGRPAERGPSFSTIQEMLALVGAGKGIYPLPAQATRFYARPDVAYVPIHHATPFEWGLIWRSAGETNRIRSFVRAALDFGRDHG